MNVREIMTSPVDAVPPVASVAEVAREMERTGVGCLVVLDQEIVGIVTDRDLVIRCVARGLPAEQTLVRDVMSRDVMVVGPDNPVEDVFDVFGHHAFRRLPVVEGRSLVGLVTVDDLLLRAHYMFSGLLGPISMETLVPRSREPAAGPRQRTGAEGG
ncbi:CBS domain-containing protein [Marinitenerispora sediminis]|uniref:CBS domain-containing protein n=1 Tax=Marinitenerispora sediminis TaxID=1931232 RepID=A0A368T829_9ACTN|nr:CBS domain-containing protein [Marinitenerispora sediminis]RCV52034.1 CBS domain-containing protein [Marinitenerispora sediminis]RCV54697.1 CBS domain-containing protein [Marinitenerispora sediminis]RCV60385.1 CBS domain-containing protein [Marinitenerispora sediminis]